MKKKREVQREKYLASKKCNKTRVVRLLSRQPLSQRVFKELFFVYPPNEASAKFGDYRKKNNKKCNPHQMYTSTNHHLSLPAATHGTRSFQPHPFLFPFFSFLPLFSWEQISFTHAHRMVPLSTALTKGYYALLPFLLLSHSPLHSITFRSPSLSVSLTPSLYVLYELSGRMIITVRSK